MEKNKINEVSDFKTVVITGSSRGLGYEMAKQFYLSGWNVVINGLNPDRLKSSLDNLRKLESKSKIESFAGNVSTEKDIQGLVDFTVKTFQKIDIWINNAGINQPPKLIWELNEKEIDSILNTNLKGVILGTKLATIQMQKQPNGGYIYNMEGLGSNDDMMLGYNIYGTSKRAVTHFTQAFAKELEEKKSNVKIGRLSPGIVITDFLSKPLGGERNPVNKSGRKLGIIIISFKICFASFNPTTSSNFTSGLLSTISDNIFSLKSFVTIDLSSFFALEVLLLAALF